MPPWHLYLKSITYAALAAFGLWLLDDFWSWLIPAAVLWLVAGSRDKTKSV